MMSILRLHGTHKQLLWTKCQVFSVKPGGKDSFHSRWKGWKHFRKWNLRFPKEINMWKTWVALKWVGWGKEHEDLCCSGVELLGPFTNMWISYSIVIYLKNAHIARETQAAFFLSSMIRATPRPTTAMARSALWAVSTRALALPEGTQRPQCFLYLLVLYLQSYYRL